MVPVGEKAGRKLARAVTLESGRIPSSISTVSWPTWTGITSSAKRPSCQAAAARWWDAAANASWSDRLIPSVAVAVSAWGPMPRSSKAHQRPSRIMVSTSVASPGRRPPRSNAAWGARLIDSKPPTRTTPTTPARTITEPSTAALMPDRQTSFTVMPGVVAVAPPRSAACLAVTLAQAALEHAAQNHTLRHETGARSSVARTTAAPRSTAGMPLSEPARRPMGVRAPAASTTSVGDGPGGWRRPRAFEDGLASSNELLLATGTWIDRSAVGRDTIGQRACAGAVVSTCRSPPVLKALAIVITDPASAP